MCDRTWVQAHRWFSALFWPRLPHRVHGLPSGVAAQGTLRNLQNSRLADSLLQSLLPQALAFGPLAGPLPRLGRGDKAKGLCCSLTSPRPPAGSVQAAWSLQRVTRSRKVGVAPPWGPAALKSTGPSLLAASHTCEHTMSTHKHALRHTCARNLSLARKKRAFA